MTGKFRISLFALSLLLPASSVFAVVGGRMQVVGVNSAILPNEALGAKTCDFSYLQIVTPIAPVLDWIDSKMNEWSSK